MTRYIKNKSNKNIKTYLFSIIEGRFEEIK